MLIMKNQNLINSLTKPDIKHLRQHQTGGSKKQTETKKTKNYR